MTMWMKIGRSFLVGGSLLVTTTTAIRASAQEGDCRGPVTRTTLVPCAVAASLDVRSERATTAALEGRRVASGVLLPSNPVLALSAGHRSIPSESANNWYATLSQELEIAGQRSSRKRAAGAALEAQEKRTLLTKRDAAALAWSTYFDVLAAREQLRLADRLVATSERMSVVARARADKGVSAPLDADLADAATIRLVQNKLEAERALTAASARLAALLGRDPTAPVAVEGELVPLSGFDAQPSAGNLTQRPEVQMMEAERSANLSRAEAFRRSRFPNPTISAFAQNDGFNERVLGVGVAIPIPLPSPVGRTYAGEIAEADALAERAAVDKSRVERELRLALADAYAAYTTRRRAVDAITPERLDRADASLRDLQAEIEAGRIGVREALVAQQTLIELLQASIGERRALCLASVELARALGRPLEEPSR